MDCQFTKKHQGKEQQHEKKKQCTKLYLGSIARKKTLDPNLQLDEQGMVMVSG